MIKKRILCNLAFVVVIFIYLSNITGRREDGKAEYFRSMKYFKENESVTIKGTLVQKELKSDNQILYLKNSSVRSKKYLLNFSKIMITDKSISEVKIGQTLTLRGNMAFFDVAKNPGNFDAARYYTGNKIKAHVKLSNMIQIEGEGSCFKEGLYKFRNKFSTKIIDICGEKNGSVISAIILGDKGSLDSNIKELYRSVGIGHILAISGLHISIVGEGIYKLLRKQSGSFWFAGVFGVIFLLLYIVMIGFTLSVIRAFVMYLFRVGADIFGRKYDGLTALMSAALIMLLYNRDYIYNGGFYLSLGAVLSFIVIKESKLKGLGINLFLLGPMAFFFYEIPTYSLILNLIIIPLMSVLFIFGMVGGVLLPIFPAAGTLCFYLCKGIIEFYNVLSTFTLRLPCSRIILGRPHTMVLLLYYAFLIALLILISKKKMTILKKAIFLVTFWMFGIAIFYIKLPRGETQITMLDVGQGDCTFIQTPDNKNYLIDGGSTTIKEVGKYRIEPFLKYKGVREIDAIFISHGDSDHFNGINELIDRSDTGVGIESLFVQRKAVQNEAITELVKEAELQEIKIYQGKNGTSLKQTEGKLSVLFSPEISLGSSNNDSLVLVYEYKGIRMLFTGDIEEEAERQLLQKIKESEERYEILKVAHHGSKSSSKPSFLETVSPSVALISAGEDNSYGHPHAETIEQLEAVGAKIMQTPESGAITICSDGNTVEIREYVRKKEYDTN